MEPFLKWAGGKRWLVGRANGLIPDMNKVDRYIEPFLGSGSMFFHLEPSRAILSDVNSDLILTYEVIRDSWHELHKTLVSYQKMHDKEFYYQVRKLKPSRPIERAARFIYLNRTCWNGLYRVNKKGEFNVPIGTRTTVITERDDFESLSKLLSQVTLKVCDFEETINEAGMNDFIFVDPPYTVKHNQNGFLKYNENIFSWEDQVRLKEGIARAIQRGAKVLITNANHKSIRELYDSCGKMKLLYRSSVIAANSEFRGRCSELAIVSW